MSRLPRLPLLLRCAGLLMSGVALCGGARAEASAAEDRAAARARIEQRYQAAVDDCRTRFAVNACLQEARTARQQALKPLQDAEIAESQSQREKRATESRHRLRDKAQDQALLEAQRRSAALVAPPTPLPAEVPPPARAASREARAAPDVERQRAEDEAAAARRAQGHQERLDRAEAHRKQVRQRLQDRALHKPLAPPLPPASGTLSAASSPH